MNSTLLQNLGRGGLGMFFLLFVCYILSNNRRGINWKLVIMGVLAQVMFAMGVLHTTAFGQPVFWMLFGVVLLYTVIRKSRKVSAGENPITYSSLDLLLSVVWQVLLVAGLILASRFFGTWTSLVMTISVIGILVIAFNM